MRELGKIPEPGDRVELPGPTTDMASYQWLDGADGQPTEPASFGIERVRLDQKDYQFLYAEGESLTFMDQESFDQIQIEKDFLGERAAFLQDGMQVMVESFEGRPIGVKLPQQVTLEIAETEPTVKGQTASSSYKPAILSNGVRCMVPPFCGPGDRIIVDTEEVTYLRRAD